MRKIIFEQVGNILLASILMIASCQTVLQSHVNITSKKFSIELNFGFFWFLFLVVLLLFSFLRGYYAKKRGKQEGYNQQEGELSAFDEREKIISLQATSVTYRILIYFLGISLALFIFGSLFVSSIKIMRVVFVLTLGMGLLVSFGTYLIAWIIYDNR